MRYLIKTGIPLFVLALVAIAIAAGCAGTPLKTEGVTSGIRAAEEVGAADVPQASLYLQLAKEELDRALKLNGQDKRERAASMLLRAEADAELAVALSHGDAERLKAEEAMSQIRQLRQDNP